MINTPELTAIIPVGPLEGHLNQLKETLMKCREFPIKVVIVCDEYEDAEKHLKRSLELLTFEEDKDWEDIVAVNKVLAKALKALGREEEAQKRLERIKTIEDTIAA